MIEYIILGFLMFCPMTGYDIKQFMKKSTSNFFDASFGSIYPTLNKLEKKGFVNLEEAMEESASKKIYSITENGRQELLKWLEEPIQFNKTKPDHLVKIFFLNFIPSEKAVEIIEELIRDTKKQIKEIKTIEKNNKDKLGIFQISTINFGINYYQLVINESEELIKKINNN